MSLTFDVSYHARTMGTHHIVPPIVVIENLHYSYPPWPPESEPVPVLRGVNLQVETGEFLALMGATASGKTTLCLALNGLVPQATGGRIKGEVRVDGLNPRHTPVAEMARRVGLVFQDPETQLFNLRVEDEIAFGLENLGMAPSEIRERVDWALDAVGLSDCRKRSPFQLSGGQQQRVAIAAVLGMTPRVLVLDEPTAGLDPAGKAEVLAVVQQLRRSQDMTIIMVEQDGELVAEFADRAAVLHEGRIAFVETPEKVFHKIGLLRAAGLAAPHVTALADCLNARLGTHYAFSRLEEAYQALSQDTGSKIQDSGNASHVTCHVSRDMPPVTRHPSPVTRHPRSPRVLSRGSPVTHHMSGNPRPLVLLSWRPTGSTRCLTRAGRRGVRSHRRAERLGQDHVGQALQWAAEVCAWGGSAIWRRHP